jgi:hypothetical protein
MRGSSHLPEFPSQSLRLGLSKPYLVTTALKLITASLRLFCSPVKLCGMVLCLTISLGSNVCRAQDLTPRAYVVVPIHSNAIILTYSFEDGAILLNPTLPITGSHGKVSFPIFAYFHTFSFFGRSASITAAVPYAVGHFQGDVNGTEEKSIVQAWWIPSIGFL